MRNYKKRYSTILDLEESKWNNYVPSKHWKEPVKFTVPKYFDKVVVFAQIKAVLVWSTPEDRSSECLCKYNNKIRKINMKTQLLLLF